jgi:hypothetical protein
VRYYLLNSATRAPSAKFADALADAEKCIHLKVTAVLATRIACMTAVRY